MSVDSGGEQEAEVWESAHVCPNCKFVINLAQLEMKAITTGIVACPQCEWSGQVEIDIVPGGS